MADLKSAQDVSRADTLDVRFEHAEKAGWLAPVQLEPKRKKVRERATTRCASSRGCIPLSLPEYLKLPE